MYTLCCTCCTCTRCVVHVRVVHIHVGVCPRSSVPVTQPGSFLLPHLPLNFILQNASGNTTPITVRGFFVVRFPVVTGHYTIFTILMLMVAHLACAGAADTVTLSWPGADGEAVVLSAEATDARSVSLSNAFLNGGWMSATQTSFSAQVFECANPTEGRTRWCITLVKDTSFKMVVVDIASSCGVLTLEPVSANYKTGLSSPFDVVALYTSGTTTSTNVAYSASSTGYGLESIDYQITIFQGPPTPPPASLSLSTSPLPRILTAGLQTSLSAFRNADCSQTGVAPGCAGIECTYYRAGCVGTPQPTPRNPTPPPYNNSASFRSPNCTHSVHAGCLQHASPDYERIALSPGRVQSSDFMELTHRDIPFTEGGRRMCQSVQWADYDKDGDMDMLVAVSNFYLATADKSATEADNVYDPLNLRTRIYKNDGSGGFANADIISVGPVSLNQHTFFAIWGDVNNDGWSSSEDRPCALAPSLLVCLLRPLPHCKPRLQPALGQA